MTAVNKYPNDGVVRHVRYKMFFFFSSSCVVNFKAVIANFIHKMCGKASHGEGIGWEFETNTRKAKSMSMSFTSSSMKKCL